MGSSQKSVTISGISAPFLFALGTVVYKRSITKDTKKHTGTRIFGNNLFLLKVISKRAIARHTVKKINVKKIALGLVVKSK